jgi:hypothetical protein
VDETTQEEGFFCFQLPPQRMNMNPHQLHNFINRSFAKHIPGDASAFTSSVKVLRPSRQSQNWTIFGIDMFGAALPSAVSSGMSALYAVSAAISDAADTRSRRLRGDNELKMFSRCVLWKGHHCIHRFSIGHYEMTGPQLLAIGSECDLTCKDLGMQCYVDLIDERSMQHKCI